MILKSLIFWMERCRELFISSSVATLCTRLRQQRSKLIALISKSASLPTPLKLFFAANIDRHCIPACLYVNDVYFILLKILEVYTIKPCSVYFISYRQMKHLCIEHCSCRWKARTESDMFLGAPYVLLTSVKISLSERKLLYMVK